MSNAPLLEMKNITKEFPGVKALDNVSFSVAKQEIHCLVGENGAGKSTLIKIMTGIHRPDQGEILLDGQSVQIHNSQEAQTHGIAAIYQEPMVFPDLNVAENIFISHRAHHFKRTPDVLKTFRPVFSGLGEGFPNTSHRPYQQRQS